MRSQQIARSLMALVAPAIIGAIAVASACEARSLPPSPAETGCPSGLINRPVCARGDGFDDWIDCTPVERSQGRNRSLYSPVR